MNNNLPLYRNKTEFFKEAFNNGEKSDLLGSLIITMNIVSFKRVLPTSFSPLILQFSFIHLIYYYAISSNPYKTVSKVAPLFSLHYSQGKVTCTSELPRRNTQTESIRLH